MLLDDCGEDSECHFLIYSVKRPISVERLRKLVTGQGIRRCRRNEHLQYEDRGAAPQLCVPNGYNTDTALVPTKVR